MLEGNRFTFMNDELYDKFVNREIKASEIFYIQVIDKQTAYKFIRKYHYLGDAKFFCVVAYGLFTKKDNLLVVLRTLSHKESQP